MKPSTPKIANTVFGPPPGMEESQVHSIPAYIGTVPVGAVEGMDFCVVAWELEEGDLTELCKPGGKIYLSVLTRLVPHHMTTSFEEATYGLVKDDESLGG